MITMLREHVLSFLLWFLIIAWLILGAFMLGQRTAQDTVVYDYTVAVDTPEGDPVELQYGIWPELANVDFFNAVRENFITEKASFLEANLSSMQITVYEKGEALFTVPIKSKGREGSWWETPSGLYRAEAKEKTHFSSFGHVYMPWSIPFQGNFFIHGWPYYPDGTPVREGYSGGCIRLEDEYAQQVFEHLEVGTPILVFEEPRKAGSAYTLRSPEVKAGSYLVADLDSNFVLASWNTDTERETTLLSTMMTAVVSSEHRNIEQNVSVSERALRGGEPQRLAVGSSYTLYDLFFPLLLEDSNEAMRVIRESFGSVYFLDRVRAKASALGMEHTSFHDGGEKSFSDTTTANDIFLFMKYLHLNRPFILTMSANKTDTRTYGDPHFSDILPIHPFIGDTSFVGGLANAFGLGRTNIPRMEAAVALSFADPDTATSLSEEDLISIFSLPFNGEMRTVSFIVLDSSDVVGDTKELRSFVARLYE